MPSNTSERLDRLEAENAILKAELARLTGEAEPRPEPAAAPPATPYQAPRLEVRHVTPVSGLVMPSDDQMRALYAIVSKAHPKLVREPHRGEWTQAPFNDFAAAFVAMGNLGRTPQPDGKHSLGWWVDHAIFGAPGAKGQRAFGDAEFVLAALAHGDVPYRPYADGSPWEFGLMPYTGQGTPAGDAWRRVLASGRISPPAAPARVPRDARGHMDMRTAI